MRLRLPCAGKGDKNRRMKGRGGDAGGSWDGADKKGGANRKGDWNRHGYKWKKEEKGGENEKFLHPRLFLK